MTDDNKIDSANKTDEQAAAQNDPFKANPGPVELNHGEISEARQAELDAAKDVAKDPWGETPLQQRDDHDPAVDPEKNEPTRGGVDAGRSVRLDPMNPSEPTGDGEEPATGGTTAPA
jgi:hypothetical protein